MRQDDCYYIEFDLDIQNEDGVTQSASKASCQLSLAKGKRLEKQKELLSHLMKKYLKC